MKYTKNKLCIKLGFLTQLLYLVHCALQYRDEHKYDMRHLLCVCRSYHDFYVYRAGYIPTYSSVLTVASSKL
jgi:hypothetical protein